jgi:hypothetical protein
MKTTAFVVFWEFVPIVDGYLETSQLIGTSMPDPRPSSLSQRRSRKESQ